MRGLTLRSIAMVICLMGAAMAQAADEIERAFDAPADAARPWVYYFIMDGNLTREGITADFEAMKRVGIGGMVLMEVDAGIPRGPVKFMSPQWRQLFKHAVMEAQRLGLSITLNAGPGWTGSGGPWVKPEQSMQHMVASETEVRGPAKFDAALPRPRPRPAYFGAPPEIQKAQEAFYVDVAVLAVPKSAARIEGIDEKALYLRHPYTSRPGTVPFLPSRADWPALAAIPADRVIDLTARMAPEGRLAWEVPEGEWTILRFGRTSTGANTRPAPAPGLGLESDKFDRAALDAHFEAFVMPLLREVGNPSNGSGAGWTSLHIDSWEMGSQNASAGFLAEFRGRRGYDALPYLPALTGRIVQSVEVTERFLWDLRQTAQELVIENHAQYLKELGRKHGLALSIEPYDMNPCADLGLGGVADVPMCEFWLYGFNSFFTVIEAASIAHTLGRPIVAAEAFTSSDAERWQAHPGSMKALGDWAFCAGVNRIVFHRYQHQPWLDRAPGMTMGPYGVHWERTQTWWEMSGAYHAYLARCQSMLRRGLPVADTLYLSAEGAPHVFRPPGSAMRGTPPDRLGYSLDGCAPETLANVTVKDGRLALPHGVSYRVLVLPERDTMTPGLLRRVKALAEAGATVIGPRPRKSPSLSGYPACDEQVSMLAAELWGDCDGRKVTERAVGKGKIVWKASDEGPAQEAGNGLAGAKWIWFNEGRPQTSAPVGRRYFRRTVSIEPRARVESGRVVLTADNDFELFVNGRSVGRGDNFHQAYAFDVTRWLRAGENVVAIAVDNGGDSPNPAGVIARIAIALDGDRKVEVITDGKWQAAKEVAGRWNTGAPGGAWSDALELGPAGMAPWGAIGRAEREAEQYGDFAVVADTLARMGVAMDLESDVPLRYIHRRDGEAEIYFVANPEAREVTANVTFRVAGKLPEIWWPESGKRMAAGAFLQADGRTRMPLRFDPHGSMFIVFRRPADVASKAGRNWEEGRTLATIGGPWQVRFQPGRGAPESIQLDALVDWSKHADAGVRHFSGTATYRTTFKWAGAANAPVYLDLGTVAVMAQVKVNGKDAGVAWKAPYRVEVTGLLRPGENELEIVVANLWPNRLIGDAGLPADQRISWTTWSPFRKDTPLLEAGLIGPVTVWGPP